MYFSSCSLCPRLIPGNEYVRPVPSVGPTPCPVLLIGAGPGKVEAQTLIPYSGLAGDELTSTYLALAHLSRDQVHIANATMCFDGGDKVSDKRVRACGGMHLPEILERVRPEVVVLMGGVTQTLSDKRVRLDTQHGIPFWGSLLGGRWTGWVWPSYEPALGMRETSRMTQLLTDFAHLGQWMRGEWTAPVAVEVEKDYKLCRTAKEVKEYWDEHGGKHDRLVAVDTETHGGKPWSIQWSVKPHTGRMVLADDKRSLQELKTWLCGREVVLHNAGQDQDTSDRMGVPTDIRFRDTMQEAFHLCSVPQGLKPLAYRLLGVTMRSWEDVVRPASVRAAMRWVERAVEIAQEHLTESVVHTYKRARCRQCGHQHTTGKCKSTISSPLPSPPDLSDIGYREFAVSFDVKQRPCGCESTDFYTERVEEKPGAVEAILRHITRYVESTSEADDPYDLWQAMKRMRVEGLRGKLGEEWEWELLTGTLGELPILGIGNCELEEAVQYGCSDADHTLQVEMELERLRGGAEWEIDEEDRDKC